MAFYSLYYKDGYGLSMLTHSPYDSESFVIQLTRQDYAPLRYATTQQSFVQNMYSSQDKNILASSYPLSLVRS